MTISRRTIVSALRFAAFGACLVLFVHALAHANLGAALSRIRALGPVALVVLFPFPLGILFDAAAFRRLLAALGRDVRLATLFEIRLAAEAVTNSTPAGAVWADAMVPVLVSRRADATTADAFAASTAKRWLVVRMHGVYVATSAAFGMSFLTHASVALVGGHSLFVLVVAGALGLVLLAQGIEWIAANGRLGGRVSGMIGRARFARVRAWIEARHHQFEHADAQLARLSNDRRAGVAAAARVLVLWIFEGLETFLFLRVLGAHLGLVEVMSFDAALSILRSAAVFAPAGIGVQDVGYLAALSAYGVPVESGIGPAFVVLKRAKELAWIAFGLLVLARSTRRRRAATA